MCRPSRWWLGLAPLAALFLVALFWKGPRVEADVAAHARAALEAQGVIDPAVAVAVAGRDVTLTGATLGDVERARAAALSATGVRKVADALKPLPTQKPYGLAIARSADGVTLTGFVPDPAARAALVQAAGGLGKVVDRTSYAAGAPQGFGPMAAAALAALAPLTTGEAALSDAALSVAGQAPSAAAYDAARAAAAALPAGMTLARFDVAAPSVSPYAFSARRDGATLALGGYAPDAAVKTRLVEAARQIAPNVEDGLKIAGGAPQGFEAMAKAALAALAPLPKAEAALAGASLSLAGEASDRMGFDAARAALASLPPGTSVARAEIAPPPLRPFPFAATKSGARVALTGAAPDDAVRARLVAAAKADGAQVSDDLVVARGAGPAFETQALAALAALAPLNQGEASLSDALVRLVGEAPDARARDKALAALKTPGLALGAVEVVVATAPAFVARRDGATITLTGQAPDARARDALVAAARALSPEVADRLTIARGAPESFEAAAKAGVDALAHVTQGESRLAGEALTVSGWLAPGETASAAARALGARLPKGVAMTLDWRYPVADPFAFEARKTSDGAVRLSGQVPGEAARLAVENAARGVGGPVTGAPALASGLSPKINFERLSDLGFTVLKRVESGWMRVADDGLSFGGEASEADAAAIRAALDGSGVALGKIEIVTPAPAAPSASAAPAAKPVDPAVAACHGQILERLAEETIEFASGSARLAPKSTALVGRLAAVIRGCPQADLEIAGHTDNVGGAERNLALSRERAAAVVKALVAAGAPADRLSSAGYGETRPIAPNDSAEGRARNRRIEFVLK